MSKQTQNNPQWQSFKSVATPEIDTIMPPEVVDEPNEKIPSKPLYAKGNKPYRLRYREKVRIEFVQSLLATEEQVTAVTSCDGSVVPPPIDNDTGSIIQNCSEILMIPLNDNEEHRPSKNHSHMTQGYYLRHKKQPQVMAVGSAVCSCYGIEYKQQRTVS
jgi:hypothetical protein